MKNIFIGPLLHWLVIIAVVAIGWFGGAERLHVSQFNPFMIALIAIVVVVIVVVLATSKPDRRVTRDPVVDHSDENADS